MILLPVSRLRSVFLPALIALLAAPLAAQVVKNTRPASSALVNKGWEAATPPIPVVQDYEPAPALWKMGDVDTTIYLFGTHHILPDGFRWRTAAFDRVVAAADELVVETSDSDSDAQFAELRPDILAQIVSRPVTSARLSLANRAKLRQLASDADMSFDAFDRMPVLFAMLSAGLSISEMGGSTHDFGVEAYLEEEFARSKKPIGSIEDASAVMRALLDLDEEPLIAQLDKDLSEWDGTSEQALFEAGAGEGDEHLYASEHDWAKGRLEPVFTDDDLAEPAMAAINQVLMVDRNRAWAKWLKARLDRPGTVLVAVGAGHFAGDNSVLAELERQGLTTERMQ